MSLQNLMVTICIDFWFQIIPLSAFGLGVWQVKRRSWKLDLLKDLEDRTTAPPVPLPFDQESLEKLGQAHQMFSRFLNLRYFSQSFPLFCFSTNMTEVFS